MKLQAKKDIQKPDILFCILKSEDDKKVFFANWLLPGIRFVQ